LTTDALETFYSPSNSLISIPKYINVFKGNTYYRNFGGNNQGLLDVSGMIRLVMQDENFT
jgi:hypothetical protein